MDKSSVLDFFGVLRIVGVALLLCAVLVVLIAMLGMMTISGSWLLIGTAAGGAMVVSFSAGLILIVVSTASRWMVSRMRFASSRLPDDTST